MAFVRAKMGARRELCTGGGQTLRCRCGLETPAHRLPAKLGSQEFARRLQRYDAPDANTHQRTDNKDVVVQVWRRSFLTRFEGTEEPAHHYLGLQIDYGRQAGRLKVHQTELNEKLLRSQDLDDCNPVGVAMELHTYPTPRSCDSPSPPTATLPASNTPPPCKSTISSSTTGKNARRGIQRAASNAPPPPADGTPGFRLVPIYKRLLASTTSLSESLLRSAYLMATGTQRRCVCTSH
ncbi:hypothetical protein T484DRAFT_3629354 [Baffinella frigidus]|nr:hypothetical protein T484DRAFT_3629354 [Cryptophyta sp. CCMP2293]